MSDATFEFDQAKWDAFRTRIEKHLSKEKTDKIIEAVAYKGLKKFVEGMPHRTGATARSWYVNKKGSGEYKIITASKVAVYLEDGTKAHGPKKKKFLYIPLRPGAAVWRKGFIFGKDYILAKKVKGIKALKYFKPTSDDIFKTMIIDFKTHLKAA
jgi:hypothetical protein